MGEVTTAAERPIDVKNEKSEGVDQIEVVPSSGSSSEDESPQGIGMTKAKWLALIALGLSYMTAFQQGACTAAIVKSIDSALGPTSYYNWILTANTITTTISLPLAGGLSDIFGRRWFMISGAVISLISAIVALAAPSIPIMILSSVIGGLGSGSQQLALAAVGELVPNRMRGNVQAALDIMILPWSVFGALTGGAMVEYHGKYGFRINFIVGVVLNTICVILAYFWYHPPVVGLRLGNRTRMQAFKELDWTGVFLMNVGIVLFLVALSLGGTTYPWQSAGFIAPFVIGIVLLAVFWYWEAKVAKNPFFVHDIFRGKTRTFTMFLVVDFVAGMGLYAAAAFWAQLARGVWQSSPVHVGLLCLPGGFAGAFGGFLAGLLIGKHWIFKTNYCLVYGTVLMTAGNFALTIIEPSGAHSIPYALGIAFIAMLGTGWILISLIVCVQLAVADADLGMATLLLGAVRAIGGSVAITIYTALLTNTMEKEAVKIAIPLVTMGTPLDAVQPLILTLIAENYDLAGLIPGVTPDILQVARDSLKEVWALGFSKVYYCAGSFAAAAVVAALISKDVSHVMKGSTGNHVAVALANETGPIVDEERTHGTKH